MVLQLGPGLGPGGLRGLPEGASTISFTFITKALAGSRLGISRAIATTQPHTHILFALGKHTLLAQGIN